MKVTGIIAEYNPFHKGHHYQIAMLRAAHCPDYVVAAMSGDFLQRGAPALMNKYARAQMALQQGADLVLELPAYFATASAEAFARGGVLLFRTLGLADSLCFGMESGSLSRMNQLAGLLAEEPDWYQERLSLGLKEGLSFPAARAKALPEYEDLLKTPNNILALEYLKSLRLLAPEITPIAIQRKGGGYHDSRLDSSFSSATAIRESLARDGSLKALSDALPQASYQVMEEYEKDTPFLWEDDFSLLLHHALLGETRESLMQYEDAGEALANRLIRQKASFLSWRSFCQAAKTKEITYTRISRVLTHLLLSIKKSDTAPYKNADCPPLPYLRILGFRQSAAPLLTRLKQQAKAPLLTAPAQAQKLLTPSGLAMLHTDLYASDLYRSVLTHKANQTYPNEYQQKLLIVK